MPCALLGRPAARFLSARFPAAPASVFLLAALLAIPGVGQEGAPDAQPTPSAAAPRLASGFGGALAARVIDSDWKTDGDWNLVGPGETLPPRCEARTATAPQRLDLDGLSLGLDRLARVVLDHAAKTCVLERGRVHLAGPKLAEWKLGLADPQGEAAWLAFTADAAARVERDLAGAARIELARGGLLTDVAKRPWLHVARLDPAPANPAPTWLQPRASQGLGQLLVRDGQHGRPRRLQIARYHAHVVLAPPVALVQLDQSFYNPHDQQEEGEFVFNLPPGASVSRFAMYVTRDELMEGEIVDRQRARQIYDTIVNQREDPAILEQIGDNLFRMRVFPIFAKDVKRVLLDFTLPLEAVPEGVAAPGARAADAAADDAAARQRHRFRLPLLSDLEPIWDFAITGELPSATPVDAVFSPTHPELKVAARAKSGPRFSFRANAHRPASDFALNFALPTNTRAPETRAYRPPLFASGLTAVLSPEEEAEALANDEHVYFLASVPDALLRGAPPRRPLDVLLLADTSRESADAQAAIRGAARLISENLAAEDRWTLCCVDSVARPLGEWAAPRGAAAAEMASRHAREFALGQGVDREVLLEALGRVATAPDAADRRRVVVFLGAERRLGLIGVDADELAAVCARLRASFAAVAFTPPDPSETLSAQDERAKLVVEACARRTGGARFDGRHDLDVGLFPWVLAGMPSPPRWTDFAVTGADAADVYPDASWAPGRPARFFGRTKTPEAFRLSLRPVEGGAAKKDAAANDAPPAAAAEEIVCDLPPLEPGAGDVFLGRLWAGRRLADLRRQELLGAAGAFGREKQSDAEWNQRKNTLRQQAIDLSQEWSLLSPHTAFLVLESEREYKNWGVRRHLRRRYWKPAGGLVSEPLPADWLAAAHERARRERYAAEIEPNLRLARRLLAEEQFAAADACLRRVERFAEATALPEFAELKRSARQGALRAETRAQLERSAAGPVFQLHSPRLPTRELVEYLGASALGGEAARDDALLKRVPMPKGSSRLDAFARWLAAQTNTRVELDRRALDAVGLASDTPLELRGGASISLRGLLDHVLEPLELTWVRRGDALLITTFEEAEQRLETDAYPIADLLLEDLAPRPRDCLFSPWLALCERSENELRQALRKRVSLDARDKTLGEALAQLQRDLGQTIWIDQRALESVGIDVDTRLKHQFTDVPAEEVLRTMLRDLELGHVARGEVIRVTTPEHMESGSRLPLRLHSARGLLTESAFQRDPWGQGAPGGFPGGRLGNGFGGGFGGDFGGGFGAAPAPARGQRPFVMSHGPGVGSAPLSVVSRGGDDEARLRTDSDSETVHADASADALPGAAAPAGDEPPAPGAAEPDGDNALPPDAREIESAFDAGPGDFPSAVAHDTRGARAWSLDVDTLSALVTDSITPTVWDEVGGPASLDVFAPTLDVVVAATDETHEQVSRLFDKLRRLANSKGPPGQRLAEPRGCSPEQLAESADALAALIARCVNTSAWSDVGGPCSIEHLPAKGALVVSADRETHEQIQRLLTLLRRRRYEQTHGTRPWELALEPLVGGAWAAADRKHAAPLEPTDPAGPAAKLLATRRDKPTGQWRWRREDIAPDGAKSTLEWLARRDGAAMELVFERCVLRTRRGWTALAQRDLKLVELAPRPDVVARLCDELLPWLPLRGNHELSSMFALGPLPERADEKSTWLRLTPHAFAPEQAHARAAFDVDSGLPTAFECVVAGKVATRYRFAERKRFGEVDEWTKIVLEDEAGRPLSTWTLLARDLDPGELTDARLGWSGFVTLDADPRLASDRAFHAILAAVQSQNWPEALRLLEIERRRRPEQPLLAFLRGWTALRLAEASESESPRNPRKATPRDNAGFDPFGASNVDVFSGETLAQGPRTALDPAPTARESMLAAFETAVASDALGLTRFLAAHGDTLTTREKVAIWRRVPERLRVPADRERLAGWALELEDFDAALALAPPGAFGDAPADETRRRLLALRGLLGKNHFREADLLAGEISGGGTAADVERLAGVLLEHGRVEATDAMLTRCLDDKRRAPGERARLFALRAETRQEKQRWRDLLAAAEHEPTAPRRASALTILLREVEWSGDGRNAAELAALTSDAELHHALFLAQARLTHDLKRSAALCQKVLARGQPRLEELHWCLARLNDADEHAQVIEIVETRLRRRQNCTGEMLRQLQEAYRKAGRFHDSQRARGELLARYAPRVG